MKIALSALDALQAERDEYLQMVFADAAAENKERRSYNSHGIRMRAEAAEAEVARLGNELAQERAKPGGSWDQAAFSQLQTEIARLREALEWLASGEAWNVPTSAVDDGRYGFNPTYDSLYSTPWGFARAALEAS